MDDTRFDGEIRQAEVDTKNPKRAEIKGFPLDGKGSECRSKKRELGDLFGSSIRLCEKEPIGA